MGKRTRKESPALIPAKKESRELYRFARLVLAEDSGIPEQEIRDQSVCGLIYEQYPYGPIWKRGDKDVGTALEMDLLARNLGVPLQWIHDILDGTLDHKTALKKYRDARGKAKHYFRGTAIGPKGKLDVDVTVRELDPVRVSIFSHLIQNWLNSYTGLPEEPASKS